MKYNVSELKEIIRNRRSIKPEDFSARKVHKELVKEMLNNALWAPSHGMTEPWYFKVFMDEKLIELGEFMAKTYKEITSEDVFLQKKFDKYLNRPSKATVVIAICMRRQESEKIPEIEEIEAVACGVQNMHLTATAYGLGGYWSSGDMIYSDQMKNYLKLGGKDRCLGLFYVGYPDIEWPTSHRKPLEYMVEWM